VIFHQIGSVAVLLNSMRLLGFERRAATRWQSGLRFVDRWVSLEALDDLVHGIFHRWKLFLGGSAFMGVLAWLLSSCVVVQPNEVAVCQRFGAYQAELVPGLHVRWPWPVESVTRLKPAEVRLVELGFRTASEARQQDLALAREMQQRLRRPGSTLSQSWASGHADSINRVTDESLLLTGDGELIELLATIRYTISDSKVYLERAADVDPLLRSCAESTLRELTGARDFQSLLGNGRPDFEREANRLFTVRLSTAATDGLGIRFGGLTIHDLHPPTDVVASYHAVAEAIQKRDRAVLDAEAEASRIVSRAEDEARKQLGQANSDAQQKVAEATALRDVFLAWHTARSTLTPEEEKLVGSDPAKREQTIQVCRSLTDLRLTLDALSSVLRTRNKILVDADKLPGTRKLFLIDPDLIPKAPLPLAFPRGANPDVRDPP
jgi:regulator of protease activity HflC (stomatin/prohibitin superfamily)